MVSYLEKIFLHDERIWYTCKEIHKQQGKTADEYEMIAEEE